LDGGDILFFLGARSCTFPKEIFGDIVTTDPLGDFFLQKIAKTLANQ
jgi:hypothetical protein